MNFSNPYKVETRPPSMQSLGLNGMSAELIDGDGNITLTSGTTRYGYIALTEGDIVTNVHCWVDIKAVTVTTIKGGLYSYSGTTGTRLAASANTPTAFDSFGLATLTLSSPYTVPATGHYLIAFLSVAATPGGLLNHGGAGAAGKQSGTIFFGGSEASQTDLDASSTISASTLAIWVGWS